MIRPIDDAEILVPDLPKIVASIFSATGLLSATQGFEFREQQQQMAVAVANTLSGSHHLAVEAGTGVGKSYGYVQRLPSVGKTIK